MLYYVPIIKVDKITEERTAFLGAVFLDGLDEDDVSRRACRIARHDQGDPGLVMDTVVTPCGPGIHIPDDGKNRLLSESELEQIVEFDAYMLVRPNGTMKIRKKARPGSSSLPPLIH